MPTKTRVANMMPRPAARPDPARLTTRLLRAYLGWLHEQSYAKSTIARRVAAVRSWCRFLCRQGVLTSNPALGLRAIRWSLADPPMFLTQLRAILRAAAHGQINLLVPMLAHASEIRQTMALIDHARAQLDNKGTPYGPVRLGVLTALQRCPLVSITWFIRSSFAFSFSSLHPMGMQPSPSGVGPVFWSADCA